MQFTDPIASGLFLVREALRSPNYSSGTSGWTINADGSAEFNNVDIRGDFKTGVSPNAHIEILDGSAFVDLYPGITPLAAPGRVGTGGNVGQASVLTSPRYDAITPDVAGQLAVYAGYPSAATPNLYPKAEVNGNIYALAGQLVSSGLVYGSALDGTTRSTASVAFTGIAGQTTQVTIEYPVSKRALILYWALCNNATAGANCIMSVECSQNAFGGAVLSGGSDLGAVRTNSTGNFAGMGYRFVDLSAFGYVGDLYTRCVFRASAGTANFVQSGLAVIGLP